mgnify:CR=1 FL=1|jgi:hypothetical protein
MVWKAGSKGERGDMLTEKEKICKKTKKSIDICRK